MFNLPLKSGDVYAIWYIWSGLKFFEWSLKLHISACITFNFSSIGHCHIITSRPRILFPLGFFFSFSSLLDRPATIFYSLRPKKSLGVACLNLLHFFSIELSGTMWFDLAESCINCAIEVWYGYQADLAESICNLRSVYYDLLTSILCFTTAKLLQTLIVKALRLFITLEVLVPSFYSPFFWNFQLWCDTIPMLLLDEGTGDYMQHMGEIINVMEAVLWLGYMHRYAWWIFW